MPRRPGAVLVTGTSTGIGRACALRLDALGFRVFATVLTASEAAALEEETSERLTALVMDITNPASIAAAAAAVTEAVGDTGLLALVNNAGIAVSGPIEYMAITALRKQFEVNVIGQVAVIQAFLPLLRRGGGRIVNIGSVSGVSVLPFGGSYAATKHAMRAINTALRMELRPWGIPVSTVDPSSIATPLWNLSVAAGEEDAAHADPRQRERYGRAHAVANAQATQLAREGSPVSVVVKAVEHAVTAPKPRARYVVGKNAWTRLLVEMLPIRLRDRIILRRVLGREAIAAPAAVPEHSRKHEEAAPAG